MDRHLGSATQHGEQCMNYNQVINKFNPAVINLILGDSIVCQVADSDEELSQTMYVSFLCQIVKL